MVGKVKFFNKKAGYGFIVVDNFEQDIFLSYIDMKPDISWNYVMPRDGETVEFELEYNKNKPRARKIMITDPNHVKYPNKCVRPIPEYLSNHYANKKYEKLNPNPFDFYTQYLNNSSNNPDNINKQD